MLTGVKWLRSPAHFRAVRVGWDSSNSYGISSFHSAELDAFGNMKESPQVTREGLIKMKKERTKSHDERGY